MDNMQNKPGKKMIVSMLRVIDRYSVEKAISRAMKKCQNPLDSTFLLSEAANNQRLHERLSMIGEVNLNKGDHFIVGDCKDISASGMFVACYPDERIQLTTTLT